MSGYPPDEYDDYEDLNEDPSNNQPPGDDDTDYTAGYAEEDQRYQRYRSPAGSPSDPTLDPTAEDELPSLLNDFQYTPEARTGRKSRVRERIEKRRGKNSPAVPVENPLVTPMSRTPRASARVSSGGGRQSVRVSQVATDNKRAFQLSDLPLPIIRLGIYLIGAVILVFGVIFGLGFFKESPVDAAPNALWVGTEWTYADHTDEEIAAFAQKLKDHRIGTLYAWVSWYTGDKKWAGSADGVKAFSEREESVKKFVRQINAAYPGIVLYGWLGFPVTGNGIEYRLNDADLQTEVAQFSLRVVTEIGFDGVFLNVEPVWNSNADDFIRMLNRVRVEVGDDALIAVAIPPDWTPLGVNIPQPVTVAPGTEWDKKFKQRVALLTDEMAIMAYNSGLNSPFDYIPWMAYQVEVYAKAVSEVDGGADIVIGIPTYDTELPGHNSDVENVSSAISGVTQGLQQAGAAANVVRGLAIYAEWTTADTEWLQFQQGWTR